MVFYTFAPTAFVPSDYECMNAGSCQGGSLLGLLADKDIAAECLLECQDVSSCEGFTWDSASQYCILFDSCSSIEIGDDCTTCVSGTF